MMKKSGSAEKKSRRRNQKLLESMCLLFTEPEIEAALELIQLGHVYHSSNNNKPEETTTGSCMKVKVKVKEEQSDVVGKTGGISSPSSSSSTITRTSVEDFGTEETAAEELADQACSTRSIRRIKKKNKFRSVFNIYNTTKPLDSIQI